MKKKTYNHIPRHLRPVKIPQIVFQNTVKTPHLIKQHMTMIFTAIILPMLGGNGR